MGGRDRKGDGMEVLKIDDRTIERIAAAVVKRLQAEKMEDRSPERWLSTKEAAAFLGVSVRTLIAHEEIPHVLRLRRRRYKESDLIQFLKP